MSARPANTRPPTGELPAAAQPLDSQLRWLIGIRLVAITSLVLPFFFYQVSSDEATADFRFLYLLAGGTYIASLLYIGLLGWLPRRPDLQAHIQFLGDLLLVTGLVYYFGGIASPFSIFYFVVVIVAAALLPRRAALVITTITWLLHASVVLALALHWVPLPGGEYGAAPPRQQLVSNLLVHLFGFVAVALLSSRLAQSVARAETALRRKDEHLADLTIAHRDVIESIYSGLITTDLGGVITSVNRAGAEILGLSADAITGRPIYDTGFLSRERWRELTAGDTAHQRTRREVAYHLDELTYYIGYGLNPLTSAEGTPTGYIVIFQDLTERRKLEQEIRLKDRMAAVGELAAGIAHEIGNPLAAISGSVQMLTGSFESEPSKAKLLDITLKESQRLDRTIKSFLKFARPKERSNVRFDIAELLTENLKLLRHSPEVGHDHQLELELTPSTAEIEADPDQISQIFWNLARNALRAMPSGGTLTVVGRMDGAIYRISFRDTGHGMNEEQRANLFHPFQTFFDGGTGIGMAIVYRIVEEHGGRLGVESEPGVGTTITVELPSGASVAAVEAR